MGKVYGIPKPTTRRNPQQDRRRTEAEVARLDRKRFEPRLRLPVVKMASAPPEEWEINWPTGTAYLKHPTPES